MHRPLLTKTTSSRSVGRRSVRRAKSSNDSLRYSDSLAQKGPFARLKLRVLLPLYHPLNRLVDRLGNVAAMVVLVLLLAGGYSGVKIWENPARVETALTVARFHWDARKSIPPYSKGIEELTRDLTNNLKNDMLPIHRKRPNPAIYNAWSEAQMVVSLPEQNVDSAELSEWFQTQLGNYKAWREYSGEVEHFGVTGWVLLAFAQMNVRPKEPQIQFVLRNQLGFEARNASPRSGWWPTYPAIENPNNASTFATAISAWALQELSKRNLIPAGQKDASSEAIRKARNWLLDNTVPGNAGRWKDYPNGLYGRESLGVSGLALHVLHATPGNVPTDNDRSWMANLPSELPDPKEEFTSGEMVETKDHSIRKDSTHQFTLPWLIIATADAYSQGTFTQKAQAARLFHQVAQKRQTIASELKSMPWLAAELLVSLRHLQRRSQTETPNDITNKSIAVLPFESDKENASFADGIHDEITMRLSKIGDLKVISPLSTQNYKSTPEKLREIAKQLGVAHVLEGSVQKSTDTVRVNVQLINAINGSQLWSETFDRKLTDIFQVESEIAKAIADQLRAKLTEQEEKVVVAKPTENSQAYVAYRRGLAYTKTAFIPATSLGAQKLLKEAVELDPNFALAWASLSYVDASGYLTQTLQPTIALREEAREAWEKAIRLQPDLSEAIFAKGYYYYACQKDYETAVQYIEQAYRDLPNNPWIPQSLALIERRRGNWDKSDEYFNAAEKLDPRNVNLLSQHARLYICLRRFGDALAKLDQILEITPDHVDTIVLQARIAQAKGDLPRASALLTQLRLGADNPNALETLVYQAILESRPDQVIAQLKEILDNPDQTLGYYNGELRFWLGWTQEVAGDDAAARETWSQARRELEPFLKEQPENLALMGDLAFINMGLGDNTTALNVAERAVTVFPVEKDALMGPKALDILARVTARIGDPDRAISTLEKLLSTPYEGPLFFNPPLTPVLLWMDPMFDSLRKDPRFQKLANMQQ